MFKQKIIIFIVLLFTFYFLLLIFNYWYADVAFTKNNYKNAVELNPYRSGYWMEYAHSLADEGNFQDALIAAQKAEELSLNDVNLKKSQADLYLKLATADIAYLKEAVEILEEAVILAPTDAGVYYSLAKFQYRAGDIEGAVATLRKTLKLRPEYSEAGKLLSKLLVK